MVRRKRQSAALDLPRHLWLDQVTADPRRWKRERFEWAREHPWPPGKIGYLAFFTETRQAFLRALGQR